MAVFVDQIFGRPVTISKIIPSNVIVVLGNRIIYLVSVESVLNVGSFFLKFKFGGMDTNNNKALVFVFFVPTGNKRKGANTINTGIRPEIDEDNFTLEGR